MRVFLASVALVACSSSEPAAEEALDSAVADSSASSDTSSTSTDTAADSSVDASPDASMETSSTDSAPGETATDSATSDTMTKPDTATMTDTGSADVGADGGQCKAATDCRLFSSYCSTAPCVCIPLRKGDAAPKCTGTMVACFVDPCASKTADCVGGSCVAK